MRFAAGSTYRSIKMNNIYFWLWWALNSIQFFILGWITTKCFVSKVKKPVALAVFYFSVLIPFGLSALGSPWSYFKPLACIIVPITVTFLMFRGSKVAICLFFVFNQVIDFIIEIALTVFIQAIDPTFLANNLEEYNESRLVCTLLYALISMPTKYLYCQLWNKLVNKDKRFHTNPIFILFPIGQAIVIFTMMYQRMRYDNLMGMSAVTLSIVGFTVLCLSDVIFLIYLADVEKNHELKQELNRLEYAKELEQTHYHNIESKRYEIAKIRHDIKNQLISVRSLVQTKNYDEAQALISGIEEQLNNTVEYQYCSVPVINAVLHQKAQICIDNDIDFNTDISINDIGEVQQVHLCSIFSNLMDNAIKACCSTDGKRYININAQIKQGFIVISTENPTSVSGKKELDPMASKGYGLKILKDISEMYNGLFRICCENNICNAAISVSTGHQALNKSQ